MSIKLPFDVLSDEVRDGADFEFGGVNYIFENELSEDMDDNGRYVSYIYKRESDGKFFMVRLTWVRYGYEDYGFEKWTNDGDFFEVEKREVTVTKWVAV